MEGKRVETLLGLLLLVVTMMFVARPVTAHLPPGLCIQHCMSECKLSGVAVSACVKYCPVHCLPEDSTNKQHYCNLGCMLDQCAKFTEDEEKMNRCVFDCRKHHCKMADGGLL